MENMSEFWGHLPNDYQPKSVDEDRKKLISKYLRFPRSVTGEA